MASFGGCALRSRGRLRRYAVLHRRLRFVASPQSSCRHGHPLQHSWRAEMPKFIGFYQVSWLCGKAGVNQYFPTFPGTSARRNNGWIRLFFRIVGYNKRG
jgi:hypothetical protein